MSARLVRLSLALSAGLLVSACASVGGVIGDTLPTWAGGLPRGTPPRAGTPGYDAYLKSVGEGQPTTAPPTADSPPAADPPPSAPPTPNARSTGPSARPPRKSTDQVDDPIH
ncbi:MAG TPA: hypothetical protein VLX44_04350 [Xanthobacteraceae bacterium]|nr:hypothetical protein [Xanthobacteraceae bacterium]